MVMSQVHLEGPCPVCLRQATVAVADFPLEREKGRAFEWTALYHCLRCRSAHFRHDPQDSSGLSWHKKVLSRNLAWSSELAEALRAFGSFESVLDIGCGIGAWLSYLSSVGVRTLGFEPGAAAAKYGRVHLGLDIVPSYFEAQTTVEHHDTFDLVTCIMVMEHLREPRSLVREIAEYCRATGARVYVSVPFYYGFEQLHYDSESGLRTVFNSIAAHVTYFSEEGMKLAFSEHGMVPVSPKVRTPSGIWSGFLFAPK